MRKRKPAINYAQPPANWLLKVGEQHYRRLMPTPWLWVSADLKKVRELLNNPVK